MKVIIPRSAALLVIDAQQGFDDPKWGRRNNLQAESNIRHLLALWRQENMSVVHVQHCSLELDSPLRPDATGHQFKPEAAPIEGETIVQKNVNSAFIGTNLESYLRDRGIKELVIVGLTTDHCISATTRMAGNLGFNVYLISDATATFDRQGYDGSQYLAEDIHNIHLASLHGEFCEVTSLDQIKLAPGK